jgi:hypothetical protein
MKTNPFYSRIVGKSKFIAMAMTFFVIEKNVNAQVVGDSQTQPSHTTIISHIGKSGDDLLFQMKIDNAAKEKLTIAVRDRDGVKLYQETSSAEKYSKTFQIPKEAENNVRFYVWSAKDKKQESFEVNTNYVSVEEVVVKKLQ